MTTEVILAEHTLTLRVINVPGEGHERLRRRTRKPTRKQTHLFAHALLRTRTINHTLIPDNHLTSPAPRHVYRSCRLLRHSHPSPRIATAVHPEAIFAKGARFHPQNLSIVSKGDGTWIMRKCALCLQGTCSIRFEEERTVFELICPAPERLDEHYLGALRFDNNVWGESPAGSAASGRGSFSSSSLATAGCAPLLLSLGCQSQAM